MLEMHQGVHSKVHLRALWNSSREEAFAPAVVEGVEAAPASAAAPEAVVAVGNSRILAVAGEAAAAATERLHVLVADPEAHVVLAPPLLAAMEAFA